MLSRILLVSLPNYLSIFLGIGLFCSLYPLREGVPRRLLVCALACLGISALSAAYHNALIPLATERVGDMMYAVLSPLFFIMVLLVCVPLALHTFELGSWDALFCVTAGYALQNFAHSLWEVVDVVAFGDAALSDGASALLQLAVTAGVLLVGHLVLIRHIRTNRLEGEGDRRTIVVLMVVIFVNIVFDVAIRSMQQGGLASGPSFLLLRAFHLLASTLTLYLDYEILYSNRMRANAAATRQLMDDQRRQYELSRDTIEAINVRCHDIRHQIRRLSQDGQGERAFLRDASELVSIYDAGVQTSNRALDVILTEKSMLCRSRGIELTCTCDGRALSFMEEQDVYSLFGNALDNAIEAAEKLDDPERRLIDVSARQMGRTVSVQVRNFYEGELSFEDGLPRSTHEGGLHGYGMRSLRLIAERYGGSLTVNGEGGIFRLFVTLPLPAG